MATTYNLIASTTLTSGSYVDFTSIPSTYKDLVVHFSVKSDYNYTDTLWIHFNGDYSTNYNYQTFGANTGALTADRQSNQAQVYSFIATNSGTTNMFTVGNFYIPDYTSSAYKTINVEAGGPVNSINGNPFMAAGVWKNTSVINTIRLKVNGQQFLNGSSFYLYGIKNS
jgi:hypothetical protein